MSILSEPLFLGTALLAGSMTVLYVQEMFPVWKQSWEWKRKKGNALVSVYFGKDGKPHFEIVKVGTQASDKEILSGQKSFLHDPECVYEFPSEMRFFAKKPFSLYVHNDCSPLNMREGTKALHARKTPDELYAALHTKVFKEIMAGLAENKTMSILMLLVIGGILIFLAEKMGWIGT